MVNKNFYIYFAITFFILLIQTTFSQTNEIIIGVDTDSIYITDIEDVHLKVEDGYSKYIQFDFDSNGRRDIWIYVSTSYWLDWETQKSILQSGDGTYFTYRIKSGLTGPCDSLYPRFTSKIVRNYAANSILSTDNDSSSFSNSAIKIAYMDKNYDPCYVYKAFEHWIGRDEYIGFKKITETNKVYLGWLKIEVIDYNEIIIKEFALNNNNWDYGLFVNEIMASNKTTITDEFGEYEDWIEVYNGTNDSIWLGNFYLTDNLLLPDKWQMPDTVIKPNGFLLLWADNQQHQGVCHTNFKLDKDGETIGLFSNGLIKIDEFEYDEQTSDISIGRLSDGGDEWIFFESPTPGESNETTDINEQNEISNLLLFPNPTNGEKVNLSRNINYKVYNIYGQIVGEDNNSDQINISKYYKGIYIVVSDEGAKRKLIVK